jgi:ATP-dependent DNA ligase
MIAFDLLARSGISLLERPLAERRRELEDFMARARGMEEVTTLTF